MTSKNKEIIIPDRVLHLYNEERKNFTRFPEWKSFNEVDASFRDAVEHHTLFDPRTNAVHWAFDVSELCRQIAISYLWMKAYASFYKEQVSPGSLPAHTDFHVTYFADNCITRMDSIRDKLALTAWAFYCPFNPEKRNEVLDYRKIIERFQNPASFGLKLIKQKPFFECLRLLQGSEFGRIEHYRHLKIHRREPRIEIYGIAPHHDWSYILPLTDPKDISRWEAVLKETYPEPDFRERIKNNCFIGGTLFEQRKLKDRVWDYSEVEKDLAACFVKVLRATSKCFRTLQQRIIAISREKTFRPNKRTRAICSKPID
jgi:hypothetical protein